MLRFSILAAIVAIAAATSYFDEEVYRIYTNQKQFSVNMLGALSRTNPGENIFFSPHSTYRALLLAYFGAEGETKLSLEQGLQLSWATDKEDVVQAYKTLLEVSATRPFGDNAEFNTVDKLYITNDAVLKSHISEVFGLNKIERVDFTDPEAVRVQINAQVEEVTHEHIKDLLPVGSVVSNSKVVLANAAFFKCSWENQFDKSMTDMRTFYGETKEDVEMMYTKAKVYHGKLPSADAEFVELPYEDENYAFDMTIFLPNSGTVDELIQKITPETFKEAVVNGVQEEIAIQLPKMDFSKEYSLATVLEDEMGIKNLFGSSSNLSGFADNIAVSFDDIVHKAVLKVDEGGSIAAAASATATRGMGPVFFANRPFVFTITDDISKEILFAGIFRGPGK